MTSGTGQCRYNPPQLDSRNQSQARPVVSGDNWCGRFSETSEFASAGLEVIRRYVARQLLPLQECLGAEDVDIPAARSAYMFLCGSVASGHLISDLVERDHAMDDVYKYAREFVSSSKRLPKKAGSLVAALDKVAELDGGEE
tara:strand:+ start:1045 stop:1470 length:426 start_codon:yes stop_codon:yes gene_type:complete